MLPFRDGVRDFFPESRFIAAEVKSKSFRREEINRDFVKTEFPVRARVSKVTSKEDPAIRIETLFAVKKMPLLQFEVPSLRFKILLVVRDHAKTKLFDPIAFSARHFGIWQGREARLIYTAYAFGVESIDIAPQIENETGIGVLDETL